MKIAIVLNPLFIFNFISLMQFAVWVFILPESGGLLNIAPKVVSEVALIRYLGLFLMANLGFCSYFLFDFFLEKPNGPCLRNSKNPISWSKLAIITCSIIIIADIFYIRNVLQNLPEIFAMIVETGRSIYIAETANINKIWGLTTLNNLVPLSVASLYLSKKQNKNSKTILFIWLFYLFLMSGITSRRLIFAYAILGLIPIYYFYNKKSSISDLALYAITILFLFSLTIFLEFFRLGPIIVSVYRIDELWSIQGLFAICKHWLQSYIATDFNNMLVILNNNPSLQLISSAPSLTSIVERILNVFGQQVSFTGYSSIGEWQSGYGTVNFLGLLWYDFGNFSFLTTFFYTSFFSLFYSLYKQSFKSYRVDFSVIAYSLLYPGIFAISRLNFLFSVQFLVCFGFLSIIWGSQKILRYLSN